MAIDRPRLMVTDVDWREPARRHWLLLSLLAAGLLLRVLVTWAYRPALLYVDAYRYLGNMEALDPAQIWPVGYSLLLRGPLAVGNLALVPLLQHLLGLGLAVLLYVLLLRWEVPRTVAALATVPVLVDAYQVQSEHNVMPETVFQALVLAGLAVLAWRARPGWWHVVVGGLLLGAAVPVRMVGQVLVVPAVIVVVLAHRSWRAWLPRAGALVMAFALPLVMYASWYAVQADSFQLTPDWLTPRMLYSRVARFVDCEALDVPQSQRGLCPTPEQQASTKTDDFNWGPDSPMNTYTPPPGRDLHAVVSEFAWRAIRGQPLEFARWVAIDTVKAFAPRKETFRFDQPVERWRFQTEFPTWPPGPETAVAEHGGGPVVVVEPLAAGLRAYQVSVGYVPPTLLGIAALLGLAGGAAAWRRGHPALAGQCLAWSLAGLALVVLPAAYQFSWRYQVPTFVLFPVAGALGLRALRTPEAPSPAPAPRPPPTADREDADASR